MLMHPKVTVAKWIERWVKANQWREDDDCGARRLGWVNRVTLTARRSLPVFPN
jgi:hypothetical protein